MFTKAILIEDQPVWQLMEVGSAIALAIAIALVALAHPKTPTLEIPAIKTPAVEKVQPPPTLVQKSHSNNPISVNAIFSPELKKQLNRVLVKADDIIQAAEEQSARIKMEETYLQ